MQKYIATLLIIVASLQGLAQNNQDKIIFKDYESSYYRGTILRDIQAYEQKKKVEKKLPRLRLSVEGKNYPTNPTDYQTVWHNKPVSQGNTGTCWCFSTQSFYESEVKRLSGKEVKLSEMFIVYHEYIERAKYFVATRGNMYFGEGSETNAVARMMKMYGAVPVEAYTGLQTEQPFHTHSAMFDELESYLKHIKATNAWNQQQVVETVKSILNHYMGTPPTTFNFDGKSYTPKTFLEKYLKLNPNDYVDFMSLMQSPYYQQVEYDVPDNWWNDDSYHNVPLDVFTNTLVEAIKKGYTVSIGGDVSEPGFELTQQVAVVSDFDIPSEYIDENARQFRFSNQTTTDDHAMHLVGYQKRDDGYWFLIKDSSSGSRINGEKSPMFGYYFFHQDYIKLKMMTYTIHKDAVKQILKKFD